MSNVKQRTFKINNNKVTIKSRPQSYAGNFSGWYVFVNGKKHFVNTLTRESAEDEAYARFANALPTSADYRRHKLKNQVYDYFIDNGKIYGFIVEEEIMALIDKRFNEASALPTEMEKG